MNPRHVFAPAAALGAAALAGTVALAGCSSPAPTTSTPTVVDATPASTQASQSTAAPTTVSNAPTSPSTSPLTPRVIATASAKPPVVAAPVQRRHASLTPRGIYVMDSGNGSIGCGDAPVAYTTIPASKTPVADAMKALLALKKREVGDMGYVNALAESQLTYVRGAVNAQEKVVDVWLTGTPSVKGTCDAQRMMYQLEMTAAAAAGVDGARIWINDKPLEMVLGTKG